MGIFSFISSIFVPATKLIDDLVTTDEERLKIKNELAKLQFEFQTKALDYETKLMESKASVIEAEAKSGHAITSMWRPLVNLTFAGLIVARWLGWTAPGISPELELELFSILKISLGGYIIGRSGEKIVKEYKNNVK
jgi:hypothetical protein